MELLVQTMHRSSGYSNVLIKPPKAPCWRDFVCGSEDFRASKHMYFTDLQNLQKNRIQLISGEGSNVSSLTTGQTKSDFCGTNRSTSPRSSKQGKRARTKLHRTRSEVLIQEEDLPNSSLTETLGETKAREFGLIMERSPVCDNRRYLEENTKRCQNWLASIEASFPLDDIRPTDTASSYSKKRISKECETRKSKVVSQHVVNDTHLGSNVQCQDVATTQSGEKQVVVMHSRSRQTECSDISHCDKLLGSEAILRQDSSCLLDSCVLFEAPNVNMNGSATVR